MHQVGAPFVDASGVRLRDWLGLDEVQFYDPALVAVAPAGFCFPGLTPSGADRPPRRECAPLWQAKVRAALPALRLIVLAGGPAQRAHLGAAAKAGVTATVAAWRQLGPLYAPTPHPSWRNGHWLKVNPWFQAELVPDLRARVAAALAS